MQSRLAVTASNLNRLIISVSKNQHLSYRLASSAISGSGKTADPDVHAVNPEEKDGASETAKAASSTNQSEFKLPKVDEDPYVPPNSPNPPSPKIQSTPANQPAEPITRQKRRSSASTAVTAPATDVSCAGLDGSPWPEDDKDRGRQRKEQEDDDKEYYERHKASPLSEMEMVDTRKPITRATDGTADSYFGDYDSPAIVWRPEQLDTAEDSLRRAMEIWKWNAMRGDPDSPHGRVLRALRGEYW